MSTKLNPDDVCETEKMIMVLSHATILDCSKLRSPRDAGFRKRVVGEVRLDLANVSVKSRGLAATT